MSVIKVYSLFGETTVQPLSVVDIKNPQVNTEEKDIINSPDELTEEYEVQASVGEEAQVPAEDSALTPENHTPL